MKNNPNDQLINIFNAALDAVRPSALIPPVLAKEDLSRYRNIYVGGAGKASAAMAVEVEKILGDRITDGFIVVKYDHSLPLQRIRTLEAAHPLPDNNSVRAAEQMVDLFKKAGPDDLIIFLLSGGASSLLTDLPAGYTLEQLHKQYKEWLLSGMDIKEMNAKRKQLSNIKGGKLAGYVNGAHILTCIISDVPGNDIASIGSGPTAVNDPRVRNLIIGDNAMALQAAARKAKELGYKVKIEEDGLTGDTESCAEQWIDKIISENEPGTCYIIGGETTIEVKGNGKGGRNMHFALKCAQLIQDHPQLFVLAAGTDGTDGPTSATGAVANAKSWNAAAINYLLNNDSYTFFNENDNLLVTGPTHTNVMDIVLVLIAELAVYD